MRLRLLLVVLIVCGLIAAWTSRVDPMHAQPPDRPALSGLVTADEGPLEGVLVSAKKNGSTISTTVVTDQSGRYRFPQARLEPGQYTLRVKATGYDLELSPIVKVNAAATFDLKLRKSRDVAAQLSNAE